MTVSVRPAYVVERGSDARREGTANPAAVLDRNETRKWQQAAAVTLVAKLPEATATDDHRTVIRDLADARQRTRSAPSSGRISRRRSRSRATRSCDPRSGPGSTPCLHKQWRPLQRYTGRREYFDETCAAIAGLVSDRAAER